MAAKTKDNSEHNDDLANSKGVRSLARGLQVLSAMNDLEPATIARITDTTKLPKATAIRIIQTLCLEGYVAPDPINEGYRLTQKVHHLSRAIKQDQALIQIARPILYELCHKVYWPSDLLIRDEDAMLEEVSNRDQAPINFNRFENQRYPLMDSAAGYAYLAWSPKSLQAKLIEKAASIPENKEDPSGFMARITQELKETKKRGYGIKDYQLPIHKVRAIAVPIVKNKQAIAALTLVFLQNAVHDEDFQKRFLPALQEASQEIEQALEEIPLNRFN